MENVEFYTFLISILCKITHFPHLEQISAQKKRGDDAVLNIGKYQCYYSGSSAFALTF